MQPIKIIQYLLDKELMNSHLVWITLTDATSKVHDAAPVTKCMNIERISLIRKKTTVVLLHFTTFCGFV